MKEKLKFTTNEAGREFIKNFRGETQQALGTKINFLRQKCNTLSPHTQSAILKYCEAVEDAIHSFPDNIDFLNLKNLKEHPYLQILPELKGLWNLKLKLEIEANIKSIYETLSKMYKQFYQNTDDSGFHEIAPNLSKDQYIQRTKSLIFFTNYLKDYLKDNLDKQEKMNFLIYSSNLRSLSQFSSELLDCFNQNLKKIETLALLQEIDYYLEQLSLSWNQIDLDKLNTLSDERKKAIIGFHENIMSIGLSIQ
ncbi:MAG: hypothetical protein AAGF07_05200 [Patescibacteria group bacterium]